MTNNIEYSKGYQAGKRRYKDEIADLSNEIKRIKKVKSDMETKKERVFMRCLEMTLTHCNGWTVDKKKITNVKGYCDLAKIFTDNAIEIMKG